MQVWKGKLLPYKRKIFDRKSFSFYQEDKAILKIHQ